MPAQIKTKVYLDKSNLISLQGFFPLKITKRCQFTKKIAIKGVTKKISTKRVETDPHIDADKPLFSNNLKTKSSL